MPAVDSAALTPATVVSPGRGVWVITDEPSPHRCARFVARKFLCSKVFTLVQDDEELRAETIEELRALLPGGLVNIGRAQGDPANVMETWA